jgi:hypothetical protein
MILLSSIFLVLDIQSASVSKKLSMKSQRQWIINK